MEFSLRAQVDDRESVVCVAGELDVATAGQLGDLLTEVLRSGSHRVYLNLGDVTFMDCAALAVLLRAREASMVCGAGLRLVAVPRCVQLLLALTGTLGIADPPHLPEPGASSRPVGASAHRAPASLHLARG